MKHKLINKIQESPVWVKVVIAVVLFFILRNLYVRLKSYAETSKAQASKKGRKAALKAAGITETFTKEEYEDLADQAYKAMNGPGTNDTLLRSVFNSLENELDLIELENAFGVKGGTWWFSSSGNLEHWVKMDGATSYVNDIFKVKGIDVRYK